MNITNLCFGYTDHLIFENFCLSIERGAITVILGESGVGKTTLLDLIAGLRQYSGTIDKVETSYMFQSPSLFGYLTIRENLSLIGASDEQIVAVLEELSILAKIDCYPHELSGGEKSRVALARVYLHNKDVWLLDEPLSSVDLSGRETYLSSLRERANQKTVVYVTHDIDEALYIGDRVLVLKSGEIIYDEQVLSRQLYGQSTMRDRLLNLMLNR